MKKAITSIASLIAVILLSAICLMLIDRWQSQSEIDTTGNAAERRATVFLIAYAGELPEGRSEEGLQKVGCDDYLVPFEIDVSSRRMKSVLNALTTYEPPEGYYNPLREKGITIVDAEERGHSKVIIDLAGSPQFGGVCDTPRFKAQIEETARLYAKEFEVRLNGAESKYRCLSDMSGECR